MYNMIDQMKRLNEHLKMPCFKNLAFQEMIQHVIHLWTKATFQLLAFVSLVSWVRCTQRFGRLFVFSLSNFLMNGICYAIKWKVHCFIIFYPKSSISCPYQYTGSISYQRVRLSERWRMMLSNRCIKLS